MRAPQARLCTWTSSSSNSAWSSKKTHASCVIGSNKPCLGRERRAELGMRVGYADDVGAGIQDRPVDVVRGPVGAGAAVQEVPVGTGEDEGIGRRFAKRHAGVQEPVAILPFRIARADVPVAEVTPAECCEYAVAERNLALPLGRVRRRCPRAVQLDRPWGDFTRFALGRWSVYAPPSLAAQSDAPKGFGNDAKWTSPA